MAPNKALSTLLDHVCETWELPAKYAFWADFFPSILINERSANNVEDDQTIKYANSKCSRYHKRELRLLRSELERNAAETLGTSGVSLPKPTQGADGRLYEIAWYVRWIVRSPSSLSRECLLDPAAHEDPFSDGFIKTFLACLKDDFSASADEVRQFAEMIVDVRKRAPFENRKGFRWPERLNQGFVESVKERLSYNIYADIFSMLFLASLYGPMDYRWEFGYLNKRVMLRKTLRPASSFEDSAARNGTLETYAVLTRITYDESAVDERDYVTCSETISLKGLHEVRIGRSLPTRVIGDTAYISLAVPQLEVLRQAEVSKTHAVMGHDNSAWVLRDWGSTSGTLVVTRSGDRFVVGGEGNEMEHHRLSNGDILCFGHNGKRAVADLPCYLFNLRLDTN